MPTIVFLIEIMNIISFMHRWDEQEKKIYYLGFLNSGLIYAINMYMYVALAAALFTSSNRSVNVNLFIITSERSTGWCNSVHASINKVQLNLCKMATQNRQNKDLNDKR